MLRNVLGLLVCALAILTAPASGEVLYGADGAQGNSSNLYTLNPATGAVVSTVGTIGFPVTGLAIHPITRVMYGATGNKGVNNPRTLITVNTTTGAGTVVGSFSFPDHDQTLTDLTFASDGTLYGLGSGDGQLYRVNLVTGEATVIGQNNELAPFGGGLAADPCDTIYVAPNSDLGLIFTVNRFTGAVVPGAQLQGETGNALSAMAFNSAGTLYGSLLNTNTTPAAASLVTINPLTGAMVTLGATVPRLDAIVFDGQFPAANLSLTLGLNQPTVAPGGHVQLGLTVANPAGAAAFDLFFAVLIPPATSIQLGCPAGDGIVFLANGFSTAQTTCVSTIALPILQPLYGNVCIPAGLPATNVPNLFSLTWPAVPAGKYSFVMLATPVGAFARSAVEIRALSLVDLQASSP